MDTQRLILLFIFGFSVLMLWEAWQREHRPAPPATVQQPSLPASLAAPKAAAPSAPANPGAIGAPAITPPAGGESIRVTTDPVGAHIDTVDGPPKRLSLPRHQAYREP